MAGERAATAADLDEDLFDFPVQAEVEPVGAEEDLDEVFAQFEAEEARRVEEQESAPDETAEPHAEDELPGDEEFAGLSPDPAPAIPSERSKERPAPPLRAPSAEEVAGLRGAPPPAAQRPSVVPVAPAAAAYPAPGTAFAPPAWAVPVYAPAPAAPGLTPGVRAAVWILIAMAGVNALVALVALRSTGDLRRTVADVGAQVTETANDLMRETLRAEPSRAAAARAAVEPGKPADAQDHPTFDLVLEDLRAGEYVRARKRLYALLAIVDRLDPQVREQVEARATFLLARALHMESVERLEATR